jgi:hypothetical protein
MPTFTVVGEFEEDLRCVICLDPWTDPVELLPCRHVFCRGCLPPAAGLRQCPTCRGAIKTLAEPNRILRNLADEVRVKCDECAWEGARSSRASHSKECRVRSNAASCRRDPTCQQSSAYPPPQQQQHQASFAAAPQSHQQHQQQWPAPPGPVHGASPWGVQGGGPPPPPPSSQAQPARPSPPPNQQQQQPRATTQQASLWSVGGAGAAWGGSGGGGGAW